jgi:hypothetical protein
MAMPPFCGHGEDGRIIHPLSVNNLCLGQQLETHHKLSKGCIDRTKSIGDGAVLSQTDPHGRMELVIVADTI